MISQSLWITVLGMGLVFAALVLLAGLMSAMTRLFRDSAPFPSSPPAEEVAGDKEEKARAAAVAVAVALAEQSQSMARPIVPPQPAIIGAWQLGMRTRQMTQKGATHRRGK